MSDQKQEQYARTRAAQVANGYASCPFTLVGAEPVVGIDAVENPALSKKSRKHVVERDGILSYMSGVSTAALRDEARELGVGLLIQPGNGYHGHVQHYPFWGADNGAYRRGARWQDFDFASWWRWVEEKLPEQHRDSCAFVVAPDAIDVSADGREVHGYATETIRRAKRWLPKLRALGWPTAFVAQNGMEDLLHRIPWAQIDVLFIGGSTEWKLGEGARVVVAEAKARGKGVHMGRVNSGKRFRIAADIGCDTADGTFLAFGPEKNLPRLRAWVRGDA